jgi:hypothetical protein
METCRKENCEGVLRYTLTHPQNPIADVLQCNTCGAQFHRYEGTRYERTGDPKKN